MIGSFAPHGINVVVIIVILRSLSFSIVLDAIIPGTPQPEPINIGIKDFPERPNLQNILSIINAIRAIYPQASKNARNANNINICGTNPSTAPTPATIPSRIRLCSQSAQPIAVSPCSIAGGISVPNKTSFVQSVTKAPTVVTDTKYTINMTKAKIGSASHLFVTILSILSDTVKLFLRFFLMHSFIIEEIYTYRSFVIILSVSSSNASSNALISEETSGASCIRLAIFSSFSRSFTAKKRLCFCGTATCSLSDTFLIAFSTASSNLWVGIAASFPAAATAFSAACVIPIPLSAEIITISQPSFSDSLSMYTTSLFFSRISAIFTAKTTGIPSSKSCVVKYRFRSILVPSTIFKITSGCSLNK